MHELPEIEELVHYEETSPRLYAVGWVSIDCTKGKLPSDVDEQIFYRYLQHAIEKHTVYAKTTYLCPFCKKPYQYGYSQVDKYRFPILVPHLMQEHGYLPPHEFIDAVICSRSFAPGNLVED